MSASSDDKEKHISPLELAIHQGVVFVGGTAITLTSANILKGISEEYKLITDNYNKTDFENVQSNTVFISNRAISQTKPLPKEFLNKISEQIDNLMVTSHQEKINTILAKTNERIEYAKEHFYTGNDKENKDSINHVLNETYISIGKTDSLMQHELSSLNNRAIGVAGVSLLVLGGLVYAAATKFLAYSRQNK